MQTPPNGRALPGPRLRNEDPLSTGPRSGCRLSTAGPHPKSTGGIHRQTPVHTSSGRSAAAMYRSGLRHSFPRRVGSLRPSAVRFGAVLLTVARLFVLRSDSTIRLRFRLASGAGAACGNWLPVGVGASAVLLTAVVPLRKPSGTFTAGTLRTERDHTVRRGGADPVRGRRADDDRYSRAGRGVHGRDRRRRRTRGARVPRHAPTARVRRPSAGRQGDPAAKARIDLDHGAVLRVDGDHGFGHITMREVTDLAVDRARTHGMAVARGSPGASGPGALPTSVPRLPPAFFEKLRAARQPFPVR